MPRLRAALPSLQPSDARVARAILDEPEAVIRRSVTEVATAAGTSASTVVRCVQKAGFRGFHELKLALAQDLAVFEHERRGGSPRGGDPASVLLDVCEVGAQTVRDAAATVDHRQLARAVEHLTAARHVLLVAVGTSAPLAQDAAYRFSTIGLAAQAPADVHVQHVAARLLAPGDVCLAISHTGSTRETCSAVRSAAGAGAATIVLTSFLRSPLTDLADVTLVAGMREVSMRLEGMASRLAHMAVLDALIVSLAVRDEARAQRALDRYADVLSEHRY